MIKPVISIIIPVNNVEGYLPSCLGTLVNQTFKDLEIICIDDGSTDNSLRVLQEFAGNDSRIKVLSQAERKGTSCARNLGLKNANGEYVAFVDGDDWVEPDMFDKLYESAKKHDTDITICAVHFHNEFTQKSTHNLPYYNLSNFPEALNDSAFSPEETAPFLLDINTASWNKIYKRKFLKQIKAEFKEGFIYSDLPFFYETYLKAKRVSIVRDFLYFYRANRLDSTTNKPGVRILDRPAMVCAAYECLKKVSFFEKIKQNALFWVIDDLFHTYTLVESKYQKEFYFRMKKIFNSLDLEGISPEELKKFYFYEEFNAVLNSTYDSYNHFLFLKYKNLKKKEQQSKQTKSIRHQKTVDYYEAKIKELSENNKNSSEIEVKAQKDWYNNLLATESEKQKKVYESQKTFELEQQRTLLEKEADDRLQAQNNIAWAKFDITKKQIDDFWKNEIEEKLKEQKNRFEQQIEEARTELNNFWQAEMQKQLEEQKQLFDQQLEEARNEVQADKDLETEQKLTCQKDKYENKIRQVENTVAEQKTFYENEINQVKFVLKVVKKLKKIKHNIKNRLKL